MANLFIPQPPVTNYNPIRVLWTDIECEYLLNQRMSRNNEFWNLESGTHVRFWQSIARKINECFGTIFTGNQVKTKWKNLKQAHLVSIFYIN